VAKSIFGASASPAAGSQTRWRSSDPAQHIGGARRPATDVKSCGAANRDRPRSQLWLVTAATVFRAATSITAVKTGDAARLRPSRVSQSCNLVPVVVSSIRECAVIDVGRSLDDSALRFWTDARTTREGSAETTRPVAVPLGSSLRRARSASCLRRAEYPSPLPESRKAQSCLAARNR